jgi:serine acetyltransferase
MASRSQTIIGDDSIIRSGTVIYGGVSIGHHFDCGHSVLIREGVVIGDHVYTKSLTHLMRNVRIGDWCRLSAIIADNTTVGVRTSVFGTLTHRNPKRSSSDKGPWIGPNIGDDCLIGRGAVVLGPCSIGSNSTVGANAFVDFDVAPGVFIVGQRGNQRQGGQRSTAIAQQAVLPDTGKGGDSGST